MRFPSPWRPWVAGLCAMALAGCGHSGKNDPVAAINAFFTDLSRQHFQQAYDNLSSPMRVQLSEAGFEAISRDLGLGNFNSCTWNPPSVDGREAVVNGEVTDKAGNKATLRATMLKERGEWRLYTLETFSPQDPSKSADIYGRFKYTTSFNDGFTRRIPTDDEIRKLVSGTMLKFNECLHKKDFKDFYESTSELWQQTTKEEQVARAFKPYLDQGATLDFIKDSKVIFSEPPRLNSNGYLNVDGYYPTRPRVIFRLQYVFELPRWKIIGITLSVEP